MHWKLTAFVLFCCYLGSYPIAINLGVSPPGNHELTITVKDDDGFMARDTVPYFLGSDSVPTGLFNDNYFSRNNYYTI